MSPTPTSPNPTELQSCPHGPRAGTTTCLYCRNDARAAARQRRNRVITRFSLMAMGSLAVVALIVGAVISLAPGGGSVEGTAGQSAAGSVSGARGVATSGQRTSGLVLEPSVPEGRSTLGDSIVVERRGGDVTVSFDTETLRTRYDWKFEGVVRATLPLLFGDDARIALDSIRTGDFVRAGGGSLLRDLPTRGIRLALSGGRSLTVRPITRPGQDGPLVVGYRATADRN